MLYIDLLFAKCYNQFKIKLCGVAIMKKLFSIFLAFLFGITAVFYTGAHAQEESNTPSTSPKVLEIVKQGDVKNGNILRKQAEKVEKFDKTLADLLDDMALTMKKNDGVGIAAPQVGRSLRIFLVEYKGKITEYINPEITFKEGTQDSMEGCLSVPDLYGIVKRPKHIKGTAFDRFGKQFDIDATGDEACRICHEYDHLCGKLFTDSATRIFTADQMATIETIARWVTIGAALVLILIICGLCYCALPLSCKGVLSLFC